MVSYQFIRYSPSVAKLSQKQQSRLVKKHVDYLKVQRSNTNVLTEALFDKEQGGILIVNGELTNAVIGNDPAVREGLLTTEIKKLWIAKGAFCEN